MALQGVSSAAPAISNHDWRLFWPGPLAPIASGGRRCAPRMATCEIFWRDSRSRGGNRVADIRALFYQQQTVFLIRRRKLAACRLQEPADSTKQIMRGIAPPVQGLDRPSAAMPGFPAVLHPSPCDACPVRATNFCAALLEEPPQRKLTQRHDRAERRDILFGSDRPSDSVYLVCDGWAFAFRRFRDGRRHILRFLIPGDVVCSPFDEGNFSVQALTDLRFCKFVAAEVKARIVEVPQIFDAWMAQLVAERSQLAASAVALGQFDAAERIAHLVLGLRDRLETRGLMHGESLPFPVRQSHIADATGLTSVHVSRTLSAFRKDGVFAIEDGLLKIIDLTKLRRIGDGR
jgi:CRP-like cAMP-binding protein